jgi:hypothetical protein
MAKISTYANVGSPQLADKLIGTKVGGTPADATYNFTLNSLLGLFAENITLQNVLDAGNTATEDINLTGNIYVTLVKPDDIEDETSSTGTPGQFLSKTATGILWDNAPIPPTPTLDEVLTAGNVSIQDASIGTIFLYNPHALSGNGYVSITGDKNRFNFYDNTGFNIARLEQDALTFIDPVDITRIFQIAKPAAISASRVATFQDASGTIAYLSDIPVAVTPDLQIVLNAGNTATEDINLTGQISTTDFEAENDIYVSTLGGSIRVGRGTGNNGKSTVLGALALSSADTGDANTAVGYEALRDTTSGNGNTAFGAQVLISNTTGALNTAVGSQALRNNLVGNKNTAIGNNSLTVNTGDFNTAVGYESLVSNTSGTNNVAIGLEALRANIAGVGNVAVGVEALNLNLVGSDNVAIGKEALRSATVTGQTAVGYFGVGRCYIRA